jgi:hypothetical protein
MIMGFFYFLLIFFPSIVGMLFVARWLGEDTLVYLFSMGGAIYLNAKLLDYLSKRYEWYWLETWRK